MAKIKYKYSKRKKSQKILKKYNRSKKRNSKKTKMRKKKRNKKSTKRNYKKSGGSNTIIHDIGGFNSLNTDLIVIRHALSCANAIIYSDEWYLKRKVKGHRLLDPRLTSDSIGKCEQMHGVIQGIIQGIRSNNRSFILCCSSLLRAQETCYHLFKGNIDASIGRGIHVLPYCKEIGSEWLLDDLPDPNVWKDTMEETEQKLNTKVQGIHREEMNTNFRLNYFTPLKTSKDKGLYKLAKEKGDLKTFQSKLKELREKFGEPPVIIVVSHSAFIKDELKFKGSRKGKFKNLEIGGCKIERDGSLSSRVRLKGTGYDKSDIVGDFKDQYKGVCEEEKALLIYILSQLNINSKKLTKKYQSYSSLKLASYQDLEMLVGSEDASILLSHFNPEKARELNKFVDINSGKHRKKGSISLCRSFVPGPPISC